MSGGPEGLRKTYSHFNPRVGFAYRPFADNNTVLRGGVRRTQADTIQEMRALLLLFASRSIELPEHRADLRIRHEVLPYQTGTVNSQS